MVFIIYRQNTLSFAFIAYFIYAISSLFILIFIIYIVLFTKNTIILRFYML